MQEYQSIEVSRDLQKTVTTIAVVGASDKTNRPVFGVMRFLQSKGYRCLPVNPRLKGTTILGETVFGCLDEIESPIDMVDIFRNPKAAGLATDEAIRLKDEKGIKSVWMQLEIINEEAAARAEAAGLQVVMDRCPAIEMPRLGLGPDSHA